MHTNLRSRVVHLASTHLDVRRMAHAYLANAQSNARSWMLGHDTVPHKQYLYVIRPLLALRWLRVHHDDSDDVSTAVVSSVEGEEAGHRGRSALPPVCFQRLVAEQLRGLDQDFLRGLAELVKRKQEDRLTDADRPLLFLQRWCEKEIQRSNEWIRSDAVATGLDARCSLTDDARAGQVAALFTDVIMNSKFGSDPLSVRI
mmetsp:Transcript_8691/g.26978  ORF Transcript_8691/g.26978 Transcript_8691/m.26978 type:complete len:201 (-) Transcript_8691:27-629(-)